MSRQYMKSEQKSHVTTNQIRRDTVTPIVVIVVFIVIVIVMVIVIEAVVLLGTIYLRSVSTNMG